MPDGYTYIGGGKVATNTIPDGQGGFTHALKMQAVASDGTASNVLTAATDRSGSITTGGTAQQVAAANTARRGLDFQNTSDTEMRVTESGTAATATTGYQVAAGGRFSARTNRAISVFCATTGKTFAATEW